MTVPYKYVSTKSYRHLGPVAYRQWRADSHCKLIHGYSLSFYFEFGSNELDVRNWVVDFGSLKPLKTLLEDWFDHTLLVAEDDPHKETLVKLGELKLAKIVEVERTGCEGLADYIYTYINTEFLKNLGYTNVWCTTVEVRETDSNMAKRTGTLEDERNWALEKERSLMLKHNNNREKVNEDLTVLEFYVLNKL